MLKRRDTDDEDEATTGIESYRRSIDEGWASMTQGSDRRAAHDSDRAERSQLAGDQLQAAYDAASRRAADWYTSRLEAEGDETTTKRGRTRHVSSRTVPAASNERIRRTTRVDR
jgi:hypothetical protein